MELPALKVGKLRPTPVVRGGITEGIEDEALLELMYKYMKRVIDEEKEKKNG